METITTTNNGSIGGSEHEQQSGTKEVPKGLIAALAESLGPKDTLVLAIAHTDKDGELLITIQPFSDDDKVSKANIPLIAKGSPAEIDAKLAEAMASFVPARKFVTQTAAEIAEKTKAAAEQAKKDAEENRKKLKSGSTATPAAKKTSSLTINVTPNDATLVVKDSSGKEHDVEVGQATTLELGKYSIEASKDGYESKTTSHYLALKDEKVDITLQAATPSLFGGA